MEENLYNYCAPLRSRPWWRVRYLQPKWEPAVSPLVSSFLTGYAKKNRHGLWPNYCKEFGLDMENAPAR